MTVHHGSRLVFVAGAPRSGTTLVQNMLDSHPNIVGAPEFPYVGQLMETRARLHQDIERGSIDSFCSKPVVDAQFAHLIENLLLPLADHRDGTLFVSEKTPQNVLVFAELLEVFPTARFIHVVRDPRAVVASLLKVGQRVRQQGQRPNKYTRSLQGAIRHVTVCLTAAFKSAAIDPSRLLTVRYEDVVVDPAGETQRMCRHLALEWDDAMVTPSRFQHVAETAITEGSGNVWYTRESFNHDPDPARVDNWREVLTRTQQVTVCRAFSGNSGLAALGYDLSVDSVARFVRMRASMETALSAAFARASHARPARRLRRRLQSAGRL